MALTKAKIIMAGLAVTAVCIFAPQQLKAQVPEEQMDGVMGQSIEDETVYGDQPDLDTQILKNAPVLTGRSSLKKASAYTSAFLNASFTTIGDYNNATYYHKADYEDDQLINGIDVSYWQANESLKKKYSKDRSKWTQTGLDWERIHAAGIDFAFVRVASRDTKDGSIYTDNCADSHIQGALSNDINVGLYFFSQALNETEARAEAQYVLNLIDKYGWDVSMPIVMDREAGANKRLTGGKLSKAKETAVCQAFADTITAAGYRAGVYASYAWIKNYINTDALYDCSLWVARYNNTTTSYAKSGTPYADAAYDYEFWQYSSSAKIDGYAKSLDVNFWYKDTSEQTTGLKASDGTSGTVNLSWDSAASDVDGYQVWRYDAGQGKYVFLKAIPDCSYADTTIEGGKDYQYKVRCYWTIGGTHYYGTFSSAASVTTLPQRVCGITTQMRTADALGLSWKQTQGAAGYQIYQYNAATNQYEIAADVASGATSYTLSGLTGATEYKFQIRAYENNNGNILPGSFSDVYTDCTLPGQVDLTAVSATGTSALKLTWKAMTGADGYIVYRLDTATGKYKQIATVKGAQTVSYNDQKLAAGKAYTYQVCAYKTCKGKNYTGKSSTAVKGTTKTAAKPAKPVKPAAKPAKPAKVKTLKLSTKASAVTLQWSKVSGATGYQVYRLNTKTGKYTKIAAVRGTSYRNTKLKKGATYRYKVCAYKTVSKKNYYGAFSNTTAIKVK